MHSWVKIFVQHYICVVQIILTTTKFGLNIANESSFTPDFFPHIFLQMFRKVTALEQKAWILDGFKHEEPSLIN
jgi:hypothetical protein